MAASLLYPKKNKIPSISLSKISFARGDQKRRPTHVKSFAPKLNSKKSFQTSSIRAFAKKNFFRRQSLKFKPRFKSKWKLRGRERKMIHLRQLRRKEFIHGFLSSHLLFLRSYKSKRKAVRRHSFSISIRRNLLKKLFLLRKRKSYFWRKFSKIRRLRRFLFFFLRRRMISRPLSSLSFYRRRRIKPLWGSKRFRILLLSFLRKYPLPAKRSFRHWRLLFLRFCYRRSLRSLSKRLRLYRLGSLFSSIEHPFSSLFLRLYWILKRRRNRFRLSRFTKKSLILRAKAKKLPLLKVSYERRPLRLQRKSKRLFYKFWNKSKFHQPWKGKRNFYRNPWKGLQRYPRHQSQFSSRGFVKFRSFKDWQRLRQWRQSFPNENSFDPSLQAVDRKPFHRAKISPHVYGNHRRQFLRNSLVYEKNKIISKSVEKKFSKIPFQKESSFGKFSGIRSYSYLFTLPSLPLWLTQFLYLSFATPNQFLDSLWLDLFLLFYLSNKRYYFYSLLTIYPYIFFQRQDSHSLSSNTAFFLYATQVYDSRWFFFMHTISLNDFDRLRAPRRSLWVVRRKPWRRYPQKIFEGYKRFGADAFFKKHVFLSFDYGFAIRFFPSPLLFFSNVKSYRYKL